MIHPAETQLRKGATPCSETEAIRPSRAWLGSHRALGWGGSGMSPRTGGPED